MNRTPYLTALSDAEWNGIASLFPAPCVHGRPRLHSPREIINALLSLLRSGCAWRLLPHDLPRLPNGLSLLSSLPRDAQRDVNVESIGSTGHFTTIASLLTAS